MSLWLEKPENEQLFYDFLKTNYTTDYIMGNFDTEATKKHLLAKIKEHKRSAYVRKFRTKLSYVASGLVAIVIGFMFWTKNYQEETPQLVIEDKDITLELGNGDVKIIKEDGTFELTNTEGKVTLKQTGNQLTYNDDLTSGELVYNQLNVPYGKQITIKLSDGTLVHMNAGSSLKYPVEFISEEEERKVFLDGEAFFEVASDESAPFLVQTDQINVQVLGTQFNVSSYSDDASTEVVLVEGSVELLKNTTEKDNELMVLTPGYMGALKQGINEKIYVEKVNTHHYTSWTKGELLFRRSTLQDMFKTLERHYNITILNTNKDWENVLFNASFKKEPIEIILSYFDEVIGMDYSIKNNMVIIN